MKIDEKKVVQAYEYAKEVFAQIGVDTDKAIEKMLEVPVSLHCWQGDDVGGFENPDGDLTGGIQATGNYPGKARTPDELRADLDKAISFIPGNKKLNLHASYAETNNKAVKRNEIKPEHFKNWLDWANGNDMGLDFNPTLFSHPKSEDGFTLSHHDDSIRQFWVEHCIASREIGEYFGKNTNKTCVTNVWIPDGYKDTPADRLAPRQRLIESLDKVFEKEIDPKYNKDAVESKLFGIGSESYVVGSHEFYMGYSMSRNKLLCLDTGHFHPTEMVSNKISAVMPFVEGILLHVSRPVRWDSDHVVAYNEEVQEIAKELVRNNYLDNTYIGLDFFDASINRVAAWVIGTRNVKKALLNAFLQPSDKLKEYELEGDFTSRLAMQEELKFYPVNAIWDYLCLREETGVRDQWLDQVKEYEKDVLLKR